MILAEKKCVKYIFTAIVIVAVMLSAFAIVNGGNNSAFAGDIAEYGYSIKNSRYDVQIAYCYYSKYMSGVYFAYEVTFDQQYYLSLTDKKDLLAAVKETFVKNNFTVNTDMDNGRMTAYIEYDTYADYYRANGIDGYVVSESTKPYKKTFLYSDYLTSMQTVFTGLFSEEKYVNRIYKACKSFEIEDDRILLSYIYGTPYDNKMITSDADSVTFNASESLYLHEFDMTIDEIDRIITINQHVPNTTGWYIIAIIVGIIVLTVPLMGLIIAKKRRK